MIHDLWLLWDESSLIGVDKSVLWLAEALRLRGLVARIVCLGPVNPGLCERAIDAGIPVSRLQASAKEVSAAAAHAPPDLIHTFGARAGTLGRVVGRLLHIPVVSTLQQQRPGHPAPALYRLLDRLTHRLARASVVLRGDAPEPRPASDRLPCDTRLIAPFVPLAPRPTVLPKTIAFLVNGEEEGRLTRFRQLTDMLPPMDLAIYSASAAYRGPGHYYNAGRSIRRIDGPIRWQETGLLCLTDSDAGGMELALDAMAHGVPVLSVIGGPWEPLIVPGENGWIIGKGNLAGLAQQIHKWEAMDEAQRRQLSDRARQTVAKHFAPQSAISQVLNAYACASARDKPDLVARLEALRDMPPL
ncbi:MAG: glycosyltransferase family 4 protein [Thiohalocapsa sp.]|nr:glycosyltransferase family 4 protein [Thiohalocapsa sp.]MCF7989026.1 glycosyltransferase family 4 protein [Thiohalocapsa sp.]